MDRPEDIDVDPRTGKVYLMLTNNHLRKPEEIDGVNPRAANHFGHIVEITPDGSDHAATRFRWEILVRCGDPTAEGVGATFNPATSSHGWFGMPDNALCDPAGRLWIATDGNSQRATGRTDGLWAIETTGPARGTAKLFYRCPIGAELCGPAMTPDMSTLFVSVQHPGEGQRLDGKRSTFDAPSTRWPDFRPDMPPRPAVVAITRRGGGRVG
jgi:secreted PhoX family phosphatase